jgi:hypothetical protein
MRTFASGRKVACHFAVEGRAGEFPSQAATGEVGSGKHPTDHIENHEVLS